ncbi:MAG: hypothetical protein JWQ03_2946, partial [Variovorax sp.]|nr:hypothetical protein [Variovorax sp.]
MAKAPTNLSGKDSGKAAGKTP